MNQRIYNSRIDGWIIFLIIVIAAIVLGGMIILNIPWYVIVAIGAFIAGVFFMSLTTVRYVIEGDELGVKDFMRWRWYPIANIKMVEKKTSLFAAPASSFKRISITFERGTTPWAIPLEISPVDRDAFISDLLEINPGIIVKR